MCAWYKQVNKYLMLCQLFTNAVLINGQEFQELFCDYDSELLYTELL